MKSRAIKVSSNSSNDGAKIESVPGFGNGLTVQELPISRIKPNPHNARTHSPKQIRQIADSIMAFGFTTPVLVGEDGQLYAGHGRFKSAELLGLKTIPVIVVAGLSPAQQRALAIADNKIAQNAGWDRERLAIEIPELAELLAAEGLDVSLLGFAPIEIARLETEFEPAAPSRRRNGMDPNGIDPRWGEAPVVSKAGDLWELGDHTLLCGDACSADDLLRLMSGRRADAAFLDPRGAMKWPAGTTVAGVLTRALRAAAGVTRDGGVHFVCADWPHLAALMAAARPVYGEPIDGAVWVNSDLPSGALYRGQQEFIAVFAVGGRRDSTTWAATGVCAPACGITPASRGPAASTGGRRSVSANRSRSSSTPVKDTTRPGDIVLDTFAGTGTTILAAQRVQRHARALEAEPRLVDIAIRRWQAATRRNAVHAESGLSFDEVAVRRRRFEPVLSPLTPGAQP